MSSRVPASDRIRRDARILDLLRLGRSFGAIAWALAGEFPGMSRSIVAGVATRSRAQGALVRGVCHRAIAAGELSQPERRSSRPKGCAAGRRASPTPGAPRPAFMGPQTLMADMLIDMRGRERRRVAFATMVDSRGCKFPIGDLSDPDFRYCCAPRSDAGSPYCAHHHDVAFTPLKKWRRDNGFGLKPIPAPTFQEAAE